MRPSTTSHAVTEGTSVSVTSKYIPEQSAPIAQRYVFAYTVRIRNESEQTVQLKSRHWVITHADGHVDELRGAGVVGEQPILRPGQTFQYTSGCVLRTPRGSMRGSYQMQRADGHEFDAEIASFALEMPYALN